jgi:hypothetical protein
MRRMPKRRKIRWSVTGLGSTGGVKLGQPEPLSNFAGGSKERLAGAGLDA